MRKVVVTAAVVLMAVALCACSANTGVISPVNSDSDAAVVAFDAAGSLVTAAEKADASLFAYKWNQPISEAKVWADLYRNGQYVAEPVEIDATELTGTTGTIALFTDEADGVTQGFTLLLTNGEGNEARAFLRTGELEMGEALTPRSTIALEDTQATQADETNVLLVMHDGPNLTSEMTNDVVSGQTEQLIEGSTYTLVLNCQFA